MSQEFDKKIEKYAELVVKVGLNLQPGQRLLIGDARRNWGVPLEAAPLVRVISECAYKLGARFVDVVWWDPELHRIRFKNAPRDSFEEYPFWQAYAAEKYSENGDALLTILANDPDLLADFNSSLVYQKLNTSVKHLERANDYITRDSINWCLISSALPAWAKKVFPELPGDKAVSELWNAIFDFCRINHENPIAAWKAHIEKLVSLSDFLNQKHYQTLKFSGDGTDLTVGLPRGHRWLSGYSTSQTGIPFTANLPTEEVFTLPHKENVTGVVTASKPLSYAGTLLEDFSLTFEGGRVVNAVAKKGQDILRKLISTDEGSGRLGEVALVPHSSPISKSGITFYNSLIDENAASHLALGRAYKFCYEGGGDYSDEEFAKVGGNNSLQHVDFMIGTCEMDVDGVLENGDIEPVMRDGEWTF